MSHANKIKALSSLILVRIKRSCQKMFFFQLPVDILCSVNHSLIFIMKYLFKENYNFYFFVSIKVINLKTSLVRTLCPIHSSLTGRIGNGSPSAFKSVKMSYKKRKMSGYNHVTSDMIAVFIFFCQFLFIFSFNSITSPISSNNTKLFHIMYIREKKNSNQCWYSLH